MTVDPHHLPFEVGQEAESKCFIVGFRSAWFRCKIKSIGVQRGNVGYNLEFFDFPDEKVAWTKLYQKPPANSKSHEKSKLELMVRPSFPPCFRESERPDSYPQSDVVVIVEDDWEVGDLVDWWSDGCYWSGRVSKLLGNDKVQIDLPDPPIGEGKSYEAFCKDLRPSLNWSPEHGWTVPLSREFGSSQYCARLVQPLKQDEETEEVIFTEGTTEGNDIHIRLKLDSTAVEEEKYNCEASTSRDERKDLSVRSSKVSSRSYRYGSSNFLENVRSRQCKYTNSIARAETVESAIMELEELANKIRWIKGLMRFGFQLSNAMKPSWKIVNCGPHHTYRDECSGSVSISLYSSNRHRLCQKVIR